MKGNLTSGKDFPLDENKALFCPSLSFLFEPWSDCVMPGAVEATLSPWGHPSEDERSIYCRCPDRMRKVCFFYYVVKRQNRPWDYLPPGSHLEKQWSSLQFKPLSARFPVMGAQCITKWWRTQLRWRRGAWVTNEGGVCHSAVRRTLKIEDLFLISCVTLSNSLTSPGCSFFSQEKAFN